MASTLGQVEDKISWVFEKEFGHSEDWKTFRLHRSVTLIVARLVSGVFVGPRFTRDDEWNNLPLGLAVDNVLARDAIKWWPTFMQPVVGPFLPEIRAANRQISRMAEMLKPVISNSVLETSATTRPLYDEEKRDMEAEDGESEGSFMKWLLKRLDTADAEVLARTQVSCKYIWFFLDNPMDECESLALIKSVFRCYQHYYKCLCFHRPGPGCKTKLHTAIER
jgi:hypothetical protein